MTATNRKVRALCGVRARLRVVCAVAMGAGALVTAPRTAHAHPLHTTMSEVTIDVRRHVVRMVVKAFADDYLKAVRASRGLPSAVKLDGVESFAYLRSSISIDVDGNALPLRSCGIRTSADVVWLCVEADAPSDLQGIRVRNALLWNLFDDQVNIVRATRGASVRSILFVKGDRAKAFS